MTLSVGRSVVVCFMGDDVDCCPFNAHPFFVAGTHFSATLCGFMHPRVSTVMEVATGFTVEVEGGLGR